MVNDRCRICIKFSLTPESLALATAGRKSSSSSTAWGSPNYKQAAFEVRQSLLGLFSRVNYRVFKGIAMTPLKRDLASSTARANFENLI